MYQSNQDLSTKTKIQLESNIKKYIQDNPIKRCKALKRNIRLDKYIEANKKRKDVKIRFSAFLVGMDILKKSKKFTQKKKKGFNCFELKGLALNKEIVTLHLREEIYKKDKILYLISTFYKK